MKSRPFTVFVLIACLTQIVQAASPYAHWSNGLPSDEGFFPIAVWLQSPKNAARYREAGINVYVGLWRGPTAAQLAELENAGMKVICSQNSHGLSNKHQRTIVGWMHGDEPDNAQSLGAGKGYGPPILPDVIQRDYERMRANDPTRPVLLNLGQGVAYDNYIGRGVRRNKPEDYPEYIKGCDIASFDIYPVVHDKPEVRGKLEFVARGVERLVNWGGERVVWNCIECTRISEPERKATPTQVRSEVWMSLISGSRGLIYFVHEFKPRFNEAALLSDPEMLAAVTKINQEIHALAPVLNSTTITNLVTVTSSAPDTPIATMTKQKGGYIYVFSVNLRDRATRGSFTLHNVGSAGEVEVLHSERRIKMERGKFSDEFAPYEPQLYRMSVR